MESRRRGIPAKYDDYCGNLTARFLWNMDSHNCDLHARQQSATFDESMGRDIGRYQPRFKWQETHSTKEQLGNGPRIAATAEYPAQPDSPRPGCLSS